MLEMSSNIRFKERDRKRVFIYDTDNHHNGADCVR